MKVTSLKRKDIDECMKLDEIALNSLWSKRQWEKELGTSGRLCLGIFNFSNLVSFGCGWIILDELHITAFAVHPNYRREGLAQLVLSSLIDKAREEGCINATLEVNTKNKEAIAFYKACGFKNKGLRKKYYPDGNDALIQWKSLGN